MPILTLWLKWMNRETFHISFLWFALCFHCLITQLQNGWALCDLMVTIITVTIDQLLLTLKNYYYKLFKQMDHLQYFETNLLTLPQSVCIVMHVINYSHQVMMNNFIWKCNTIQWNFKLYNCPDSRFLSTQKQRKFENFILYFTKSIS